MPMILQSVSADRLSSEMTNNYGTLDDLYLEWLYGQVAPISNPNPARSYWTLLRHLYVRQFVWSVPNDDNRAEDGRYLRHEFLEVTGYILDDVGAMWFDLECSMLEMLLALSRRAAFQSEKEVGDWFWHFMDNLGFRYMTDDSFGLAEEREVEEVLDRVINRTYSANGEGGLFPLASHHQDQREVELWYQMSTYLLSGRGV